MKAVNSHRLHDQWRVYGIGLSVAILVICETVLVFDILSEYFGISFDFYSDYHIELESLAIFALGICLAFVGAGFWRILGENRSYRTSVELASGEFLRVLDEKLGEWNLSVSECEVALLLIKGLSIVEIAEVRNTMAGTIKSQSNAIYRKARVKGRHELVAYFVEDLLCGQSYIVKREAV